MLKGKTFTDFRNDAVRTFYKFETFPVWVNVSLSETI